MYEQMSKTDEICRKCEDNSEYHSLLKVSVKQIVAYK